MMIHGLLKETSITIGIKSVVFIFRMFICRVHSFKPGEVRNEHKQSGARQLEIGQQQVDNFERIAGCDKNVGLAGKRLNDAWCSRRIRDPYVR